MIIFKINYNKKIGKSNTGRIITRHKEKGKRSLYIPVDLNYFNCYKTNNFYINLFSINSNYMYRNTKLILGLCTTGNLRGEFRYIFKPLNKFYGDFIKFSEKSNKQMGDINCLNNFDINDKLYNIEFIPQQYSKICISAECVSMLLIKRTTYSIIKLPSNIKKKLNNKCYSSYGKVEKCVNSKLLKAGSSRLLGYRPTVRGSAMNACDHPHGGGEGKAPIGRKYISSFKGKNTKGVKTSKIK